MNNPRLVIEEGKFYVKKSDINSSRPWIRLVKMIDSRERVSWSMYHAPDSYNPTGNLGTGICHVSSLVSWAGREATNEEISELNIPAADREDQERISVFAFSLIDKIPDEALIGVLVARGYTVSRR